MEGTPVRGQQKLPIVKLNELTDLQSFQSEIVRLVRAAYVFADVFFGLADPESNTLQLPVWIKSHLERHPSLYKKLEQGEIVGISATEENPVPRPVAAVRSGVVLIPMIGNGVLQAVLAFVSSLEGPQLSAEDIDDARQFAQGAVSILMRLQEIDRLRRQNQELSARAEISLSATEEVTALIQDRARLNAILQMRSHQQANVAHELRTPLAAIRGYTRMIVDGRGGEINDTQREYLRIVTENTNRLITLVGWMSYVAELSAQHLKLDSFDFRDVWNECVAANRQKLTDKSLQLVQHIAEEPCAVIADREKLGYALNEIVRVALKVAPDGETITTDVSHGKERELNFKLSAKGATLPPDVLSKIFDRPFNVIIKPMAQNSDSGAISLSGVYDVVGMHGGRVFVNSSAGQGATFLFTLPAVTAGEGKNYEQAVHSGRRRR